MSTLLTATAAAKQQDINFLFNIYIKTNQLGNDRYFFIKKPSFFLFNISLYFFVFS